MKVLILDKLAAPWKRFYHLLKERKIFSSTVMVVVITAGVKLAAIARELLVAWTFGTEDDLDAYLMALVVPAFVMNVIVGSFHAALIPTYIQVKEQDGRVAAQRLFSSATVWSLGILVAATAFVMVTAPIYLPRITTAFSPEKFQLTLHLLLTISPIICISGMITIWGGILNADDSFAITSFSPIITPIVSMLFLSQAKYWGGFSLALGLIIGMLIEMLVIGVTLRKRRVSLIPKWYGLDKNLRQVINQYNPTIAGACLMCSATLVDESMAAMLSAGSLAALSYGVKLTLLPMNLAVIAVRTVITPHFSKMVARKNWKELKLSFRLYLKSIFLISLPLIVFIIIFSKSIITILFQKGNFSAEDTEIVSQIQICASLQIPFYIGNILLLNLVTSLKLNHILFKLSFFNLILNIVLNYLFIKVIGVPGIALSTSFLYIFSFSYLWIYANRSLPAENCE